jgi:hypothetical protein
MQTRIEDQQVAKGNANAFRRSVNQAARFVTFIESS